MTDDVYRISVDLAADETRELSVVTAQSALTMHFNATTVKYLTIPKSMFSREKFTRRKERLVDPDGTRRSILR
ncbi:hypothetical protein B4Q13_23540, partial [Lacticaseibacillus rhamnosus]